VTEELDRFWSSCRIDLELLDYILSSADGPELAVLWEGCVTQTFFLMCLFHAIKLIYVSQVPEENVCLDFKLDYNASLAQVDEVL